MDISLAALLSGRAHAVNLVYEDDGRRRAPRRRKQRAHALRTYAHVLLVEARRRRREEGHAGLASAGACQHGLSCAGDPLEKHATRHPRAQPSELFGIAQVCHCLLQLLCHLVDANHVVKGRTAIHDGLVQRHASWVSAVAEASH